MRDLPITLSNLETAALASQVVVLERRVVGEVVLEVRTNPFHGRVCEAGGRFQVELVVGGMDVQTWNAATLERAHRILEREAGRAG
jgi:hypothetical protein